MKGEIKGGAVLEVTKITGRNRRSKMAQPIFNATGSARGRKGGASIPVVAIADTDLVDNGGKYQLIGGDPIPVVAVTGKPVKGGSAVVVYPVDANGNYDSTF